MASLGGRKIRARYKVTGPRKEMVTLTKCSMDEDKNMVMEEVTEERDCYMVMFPQGHSFRVTSFDELKRMGYHLKPRMVDMETGDVVDIGGDPYDFGSNDDIVVLADEDIRPANKRRTQDANV